MKWDLFEISKIAVYRWVCNLLIFKKISSDSFSRDEQILTVPGVKKNYKHYIIS